MKLVFHVPTQQYGFLEINGTEKDLPEMEKLYNLYAETALSFRKGTYKEFLTFTGEKVLFDEENHLYLDFSGNKLISGSQFKKQFDPVFDKEKILPLIEKKYGVQAAIVDAMWTANSKISTTFGTAVHLAMEQWFRHKDSGTEKEYHLPKHGVLRNIVETFPLKDIDVLPEVMVSCVAKKMVGQIDGLVVTGENQGYIIDYKTDNKIDDNLLGHFIQLSFYARILQEHGWIIPKVEVWNYTDRWTGYAHEVINIDTITKESIKEYKQFKDKSYGKAAKKEGSIKKPSTKKGGGVSKPSVELPTSDGGSDK